MPADDDFGIILADQTVRHPRRGGCGCLVLVILGLIALLWVLGR
ncbi:hypothetical protein [Fontivita pretiosa]